MAELTPGTDHQVVFLPDGSVLVTQEGSGDVGVASAGYWEFDDVYVAAGGLSIPNPLHRPLAGPLGGPI